MWYFVMSERTIPTDRDLMLAVEDANDFTLRSILTWLVAYVAVVMAAGLLFLAGASVYELMWPRPVVPFSQMGHSP